MCHWYFLRPLSLAHSRYFYAFAAHQVQTISYSIRWLCHLSIVFSFRYINGVLEKIKRNPFGTMLKLAKTTSINFIESLHLYCPEWGGGKEQHTESIHTRVNTHWFSRSSIYIEKSQNDAPLGAYRFSPKCSSLPISYSLVHLIFRLIAEALELRMWKCSRVPYLRVLSFKYDVYIYVCDTHIGLVCKTERNKAVYLP